MKRIHIIYGILLLSISILFTQCKGKSENKEKTNDIVEASIVKTIYGTTKDGKAVEKYTLKNANGMEIDIITYGGIITRWTAPDKEGVYKDIVLGYNTLEEYEASNPYFGALIGRYGNRIAKGKFSLNGTDYQLTVNDGENHLHGGKIGFDKVVWKAKENTLDKGVGLMLSYLSKDGEEGYPGNLTSVVKYTLTDDNVLEVDYQATTDQETIVNLTQHSYFNLTGDFNQTILDHEIVINADQYLPVDNTLIPTGELKEVNDTPFDFRTAKSISQDINTTDDQLTKGKGYDHCWVLNDQDKGMREIASAYEPQSGRLLEISSDEPGIQFYTGNFLDGTLPSKTGGTYANRTGFCLETQHYPDSPNQPDFPSVVLKPGETYTTKTVFKFSTK
jgi:aldose 1-epimerase